MSPISEAQAVRTSDRAIPYLDIGSGTPIVLIHAFPTDQHLYKPQQDGLRDRFRIITLDLPGFGTSSPTDGNAITMSEYAEEVATVLNHLGIEKAIIGGESMGGYVALAFLQKYPERVSGLILSGTQSVADTDEARAKREASAVDVLANGTSSLISGFAPKAMSVHASKEAREYLKSILDRQSPFALASALRGMALRHDLSSVLADSTQPVLIITGDEDTLVSSLQSEAMHRLARNSKLVAISKAGHLSSLEKPVEWNAAVADYFR